MNTGYNRYDKRTEYMNYIGTHIDNVRKAYESIKDTLIRKELELKDHKIIISDDLWNSLEISIKDHDISKYSDNEFEYYRRKFYPTDKEAQEKDEFTLSTIEEEFNKAWFHHYTHNDHHPLYWAHVNDNGEISNEKLPKTRDMSLEAIIHMICDWEAMSIAFNGYTIDWYNNQAIDEKRCMTENTIKTVESLLRVIYSYEGEFKYE